MLKPIGHKRLRAILSTSKYITVTPISHKEGSESLHDYKTEMASYKLNQPTSVMWDDGKSNNSIINGLFAFVNGQGRKEVDLEREGNKEGYCQIRRIIAIFNHSHRPKDLWRIQAHEGRHVLILSDILYEGTLVELRLGCNQEPHGKIINRGTNNEIYCLSPIQGTKRWEI